MTSESNPRASRLFPGHGADRRRIACRSARQGAASSHRGSEVRRADLTHRWPQWLPGDRFLYILAPGNQPGQLFAATLDGSENKLLLERATNATYIDGYLLFGRDSYLMAQRLDPEKLELVGNPVRLLDDKLSFWEGKHLLVYSASPKGTLVVLPEVDAMERLVRLNRGGEELGEIAPAGWFRRFGGASFSPDGRRIAFVRGEEKTQQDIWIYDRERDRASRMTFDPRSYESLVWSVDSSMLYFTSPDGEEFILLVPAEEKGEPAFQVVLNWDAALDRSRIDR